MIPRELLEALGLAAGVFLLGLGAWAAWRRRRRVRVVRVTATTCREPDAAAERRRLLQLIASDYHEQTRRSGNGHGSDGAA